VCNNPYKLSYIEIIMRPDYSTFDSRDLGPGEDPEKYTSPLSYYFKLPIKKICKAARFLREGLLKKLQ